MASMTNGISAAYSTGVGGWASGASLVYGPLADELVATSPHPLGGRFVLDTGAGTGVGSHALRAAGAAVVATDLSPAMLVHGKVSRPPSTAADVLALPFADDSFDDTVAAFVLNHLDEPVLGLRELTRVTKTGGAILASVFSNESKHEGRDRIDKAATDLGFTSPDWYLDMKERMVPLLGTADNMAAAAQEAGLSNVAVDERPVDVGITQAEDLVAYRLGQANYADHIASLSEDQRAELFAAAVEAVGPNMQPYRPIVVFLRATSP